MSPRFFSAAARATAADEDDVAQLKTAMARAGRLDAIAEDKIDAATAVMGCGPAFAYQFVEALADGGKFNFTATVSAAPEEIPASLAKFI